MAQTFWFFNTDESEDEGKNAHERMIDQSCIAAWGDCRGRGAEETLQVPNVREVVFLYRAAYGMVASGRFTDERPYRSQTVFAQWGEYHRRIVSSRVLPPTKILSPGEILSRTGYAVPARNILCKIHNLPAALFLDGYFAKHGIVQRTGPTDDEETHYRSHGAGFGDPFENKQVETGAIEIVRRSYEKDGWKVKSVEHEKCGFDLECRKMDLVEDVEVKGVRSDEQCFMITAGEVEQARTNPNFILTVVTSTLSASPILTRYSGAEFCRKFDLSAIQYRALLRKSLPKTAN